MARLQALKKDEIIAAQYESMALMKKINQEEDYLKEAKEVALRILQNTLYQMVDKIESCKTEVNDTCFLYKVKMSNDAL